MMFIRKKNEDKLEVLIEELSTEMSGKDGASEEYTKMVDNMVKLNEASVDKRKLGVSKDTLLIVGGNLLGILIIMAYEKKDIISTQAMKFISKGRV